ncbi:MAG: hypothetical protein BroJett025_02600 [Patescibacteria group bacterium]|nr:MAG: hypothetical protein BroJett025_02600 [Patescibacteria group bacterium]
MLFSLTEEEFALFLKTKRQHSQKSGALDSQRSYFRRIKAWFDGKEWDQHNFMHFMASQVDDRGLSQETRNKFISMGRNIDRLLGTNATEGFLSKVPKLKRITEVLTTEEMLAIADVRIDYGKNKDSEFINKRQQALIRLMTFTGCRISEPLELLWKNVSEAPTRHITFMDTKNGEDREIPIYDPKLWELIHSVPRKNELVFPSSRDKTLTSGVILADLKKRAATVGIKKRVYNHLFRHSWATIMKQKGVSDSDICRIAGWKDPKMLQRYDGSDLDYLDSVMQMHPMMQNTMTELEKAQRLVSEAQKWFEPGVYAIEPGISGGEITLKIKPLA